MLGSPCNHFVHSLMNVLTTLTSYLNGNNNYNYVTEPMKMTLHAVNEIAKRSTFFFSVPFVHLSAKNSPSARLKISYYTVAAFINRNYRVLSFIETLSI